MQPKKGVFVRARVTVGEKKSFFKKSFTNGGMYGKINRGGIIIKNYTGRN